LSIDQFERQIGRVTPAGNATYLRPYEDDRILFNLSVWETIDALKDYVYRTAHAELLRQRQAWFEKFDGAYLALWWVLAGHIPGIDEAKKRLAYLENHGSDAGHGLKEAQSTAVWNSWSGWNTRR
jgi:hypothetical protein